MMKVTEKSLTSQVKYKLEKVKFLNLKALGRLHLSGSILETCTPILLMRIHRERLNCLSIHHVASRCRRTFPLSSL